MPMGSLSFAPPRPPTAFIQGRKVIKKNFFLFFKSTGARLRAVWGANCSFCKGQLRSETYRSSNPPSPPVGRRTSWVTPLPWFPRWMCTAGSLPPPGWPQDWETHPKRLAQGLTPSERPVQPVRPRSPAAGPSPAPASLRAPAAPTPKPWPPRPAQGRRVLSPQGKPALHPVSRKSTTPTPHPCTSRNPFLRGSPGTRGGQARGTHRPSARQESRRRQRGGQPRT